MALPMAPGERIAITMFMEITPFAGVYGIGLKQLNFSTFVALNWSHL